VQLLCTATRTATRCTATCRLWLIGLVRERAAADWPPAQHGGNVCQVRRDFRREMCSSCCFGVHARLNARCFGRRGEGWVGIRPSSVRVGRAVVDGALVHSPRAGTDARQRRKVSVGEGTMGERTNDGLPARTNSAIWRGEQSWMEEVITKHRHARCSLGWHRKGSCISQALCIGRSAMASASNRVRIGAPCPPQSNSPALRQRLRHRHRHGHSGKNVGLHCPAVCSLAAADAVAASAIGLRREPQARRQASSRCTRQTPPTWL
jgi:hypothetical protein